MPSRIEVSQSYSRRQPGRRLQAFDQMKRCTVYRSDWLRIDSSSPQEVACTLKARLFWMPRRQWVTIIFGLVLNSPYS
jgi:hypothetical protein